MYNKLLKNCIDSQSEKELELTFGQDAVGLTFNPGENEKVDKVKRLYAEIIDLLNDERSVINETNRHPDKNRLLSVAITEAQGAQMWAVKGITK